MTKIIFLLFAAKKRIPQSCLCGIRRKYAVLLSLSFYLSDLPRIIERLMK